MRFLASTSAKTRRLPSATAEVMAIPTIAPVERPEPELDDFEDETGTAVTVARTLVETTVVNTLMTFWVVRAVGAGTTVDEVIVAKICTAPRVSSGSF